MEVGIIKLEELWEPSIFTLSFSDQFPIYWWSSDWSLFFCMRLHGLLQSIHYTFFETDPAIQHNWPPKPGLLHSLASKLHIYYSSLSGDTKGNCRLMLKRCPSPSPWGNHLLKSSSSQTSAWKFLARRHCSFPSMEELSISYLEK